MPGLKRKQNQNNEDSPIIESPLLNNNLGSQPQQENQNSALHSTIHADRFDMSRFSELREEESESSFRIIIYVIVVIIIGVGLALLVRQVITDSGDTETEPTEVVEETPDPGAFAITTDPAADTFGAPIPSSEDLLDSEEITFGETEIDVTNAQINAGSYVAYESFTRVTFNLSGTEAGAIPQSTLTYQDSLSLISLGIAEGVVVSEEMQEAVVIDDVVARIAFDAETNAFNIQLNQQSKYLVRAENGEINIDIRTAQQENELANGGNDEVEEESADEEEQPEEQADTQTDTSRPSGNNFNNDFSRSKQFVTSGVTGNNLDYNETFYQDYGPYFEVAWGSRNNAGDDFVANSSAELKERDGVSYIEVKIENQSSFNTLGAIVTPNQLSIDTSGANFAQAELVDFTNGIVTIEITLLRPANFRLFTEPTISGATQIIGLQIEDGI